MWFESQYPEASDVRIVPVWAAGDLLDFGGDFQKFVSGRDLAKQEGLVFRHVLRLILMLGEFAQLTPPEIDPQTWQAELRELAAKLTESCRAVDPSSTDFALVHAADNDLVRLDRGAPPPIVPAEAPPVEEEFAAGLEVE